MQNAKVILNRSLILDSDVTIGQIKMAAGFGSLSVTTKNNSILKITGDGVTPPIKNNPGNLEKCVLD